MLLHCSKVPTYEVRHTGFILRFQTSFCLPDGQRSARPGGGTEAQAMADGGIAGGAADTAGLPARIRGAVPNDGGATS